MHTLKERMKQHYPHISSLNIIVRLKCHGLMIVIACQVQKRRKREIITQNADPHFVCTFNI